MWAIPHQLEVTELKGVNVLLLCVHDQLREGAGCVQQLLLQGLHMVEVHMGVTQGVNQVTRTEVTHLQAADCSAGGVTGRIMGFDEVLSLKLHEPSQQAVIAAVDCEKTAFCIIKGAYQVTRA